MSYLANLTVAEKGGLPRVWIQSKALAREGFEAGQPIDVDMESDRDRIIIKVSDTGSRVVSRKTSGGSVTPVIELHNNTLADWLPAHAKRVRVSASNGTIEIVVHQDDEDAKSRLDALKERLDSGKPLRVGEVAVGGGILSDAAHEGLQRAGIKSEVTFAVEYEGKYLDQFIKTSRGATKDTLFIESGMETVDLSMLPKVDLMVAGLPCTGASLAGRASNKIGCAEEHSTAGALFFSWLAIIKQTKPAIIQLENVPQWASTASQTVIRSCLEQWGYDVSEGEVGREMGAFELRKRFCMVAVTKGMTPFDFGAMTPSAVAPKKLGDVLETFSDDDPIWREYNHIWVKEIRDKQKGNGFKPQVVTPENESVGTIPRHYAKVQSTNPLLQHPSKKLFRLLTPTEHARVKGIPTRLIEGLSATIAHQVMGQAVLWPTFCSVYRAIGESIKAGGKRLPMGSVLPFTQEPTKSVEPIVVPVAAVSDGQMCLAL